jgi:hypothetical protein
LSRLSAGSRLISKSIVSKTDGALKLTQDYTFDSPSSAAGVLLGRTANGRIEWKDSTGKTLKDTQIDALGGSSPLA